MSIHPIPARLFAMARKFEGLHAANNHLDFERSCAPTVTACGTVACHGGWAGFVLGVQHNGSENAIYYTKGALALSCYLFNCSTAPDQFARWAAAHPDLWGNKWGAKMFNCDGYAAFGHVWPGKNCTLQTIADHYREVADRIEALEQ